MDAERIKKGFRRSLNHTPQPVPFIKELFDAEVRVEDKRADNYRALTLMPLPYVSSPHQVEVEGKVVYLIPPDHLSELCFYSCSEHEIHHAEQVYSPEGFRIYEKLEGFVNATMNNWDFAFRFVYNKLEIHPTLHQYIFLTFPQWHQEVYHLSRNEIALRFKRAVENYGGLLGKEFREAVKYNGNHRKAFEYEKYVKVFDYWNLLGRLLLFTFSNKDFKFFLRLKDFEQPIKELGIDLEIIREKLKGLKGLKCAKERVEYLLKYLPEPEGDVDNFADSIFKFVRSLPIIIYDENKKRYYASNYKNSNKVWLGYHVDLSIAFGIRKAKILKEKGCDKEDPRLVVRCPFSGSEQFERCKKCMGKLYPEKDFNGHCEFLKRWSKSEGLKALCR